MSVTLSSSTDVMASEGWFWSPSLKAQVPYWIFIPSRRSENDVLPVVYFLHGLGESHLWFQALGGRQILEEHLQGAGVSFALVALMGKFGEHNFYWVDEAKADAPNLRSSDGAELKRPVLWASMLIKELIPQIERQYQLGGEQKKRLISGISMGSAGAFQLALNHPQYFRCVAGHSLVLRTAESALVDFPEQFGDRDGFRKRDPVTLIAGIGPHQDRPFEKAWIDLGGREPLERRERAREFRAHLLRLGYEPSWLDVGKRDPIGGHDRNYWTRHLPQWVEWYSRCFTSR